MRALGGRFSLLRLGLGVVALACSLALLVRLVRDNPDELWWMLDLEVYRWGGEMARHGSGLYTARFNDVLPFTYTPLAAIIFMPLSRLDFDTLKRLITWTDIAALAWSTWLAWSAVGGRSRLDRAALTALVVAAAIWLEPVQQTLRFGQINLFLMAIVLADLCRPDDRRAKGIGVGVATGIKLTPGIFVVYLLLTRRFRAAGVAVATFAATVAAGFVVLPSDARHFWFDRVFLDSSRVGSVTFIGNQSLHGAWARFAGGGPAADPWWVFAAIAVAAAGLALAVHASRAGRELHAVLWCALTGLLVSPISWSHHWVWIVPGGVAVLDAAMRATTTERRATATALAVALTALFAAWVFHLNPDHVRALPHGIIWLAPRLDLPDGHQTFVQDVQGNLYVIVGLVAIAAGLGSWWRQRASISRKLSTNRPSG